MQKFTTPAPITTTVNIPAGRVQVIAADRADSTVEVRPADPGRNRDVKAAEQTTVDYRDGVLHVQSPAAKNQLIGPSGAIEVTIQLPTGSKVEAKTAAAEFRAAGRLGDVDFDAYRDIRIDEADSVRLTAMDGNVEVGRLNGPAEISTTRGSIRITEAVRGNVVLRTQAGDVSVGAASGVSATLDAGTTVGRIHNSLNNTDGANAQLTLHATTTKGNIEARSL